jgi:hypothetical protein
MIPAGLAMFLLVPLLVAVPAAQQSKLKVYISADMEGIGAVDTLVQTLQDYGHRGSRFLSSRRRTHQR